MRLAVPEPRLLGVRQNASPGGGFTRIVKAAESEHGLGLTAFRRRLKKKESRIPGRAVRFGVVYQTPGEIQSLCGACVVAQQGAGLIQRRRWPNRICRQRLCPSFGRMAGAWRFVWRQALLRRLAWLAERRSRIPGCGLFVLRRCGRGVRAGGQGALRRVVLHEAPERRAARDRKQGDEKRREQDSGMTRARRVRRGFCKTGR